MRSQLILCHREGGQAARVAGVTPASPSLSSSPVWKLGLSE